MLSNMLLITMFVLLQPLYIQGQISIFVEDIQISYLNEEYVEDADVFIDDENNGIYVDFDIIKTLPVGSTAKLAILGFSMGKYNAPSGIDLTLDLCEMMEETIVFGPVVRMFGLTSDECPPGPGHYGTEDFHLPSDNLPEDFIANKYLSTFEIQDETNNSIFKLEVYIDIH